MIYLYNSDRELMGVENSPFSWCYNIFMSNIKKISQIVLFIAIAIVVLLLIRLFLSPVPQPVIPPTPAPAPATHFTVYPANGKE